MPIDFPDTPTVGDLHTVGSRTWRWDGEKWLVVDKNDANSQYLYDLQVLFRMETY